MKSRIICISPRVRDPKNASEIYNLFWVWFPDARYEMATHFAYNVNNNNRRLSFDQILNMRMFTAVVFKEENIYDRAIKDYKRKSAMDQLLEATYIRESLRENEHEMWEF